jgi:hypothetical protein
VSDGECGCRTVSVPDEKRRPGTSPPVCTAQPPSGDPEDEEGTETRFGATIAGRESPRVRISGLACLHCLTGTAAATHAAPSGRRPRRASLTSLLPPHACASPLGQPAGPAWQGGRGPGCQSPSRQRSTRSRWCSESGSALFDLSPHASAFQGCLLFYKCSHQMQDVEEFRGAKRRIGVPERGVQLLPRTRQQVPAEVIQATP